jgi:hypothetical protein
MLIVAIGGCQALIWAYAAFAGGLADPGLSRAERWRTQMRLSIPPAMFLALLAAELARGGRGASVLPFAVAAIASATLLRLLRRRTRPGGPEAEGEPR